MRMRKKPNLIPRMERCASVQIREPEEYRGAWLEKFPQYHSLYVELGCGKGRFTADTAVTIPETLLVAVEKVPDAMVVGMERVFNGNIENVRFLDRDVQNLPAIFAEHEIDRLYINFCDPWPAKRHIKRRLTSGGFLEMYKTVLKSGGEIHFKTDNSPLFEYSLEEFASHGFELHEVTRNLHENGPVGVMTDYEAKFHEQGVPINRCVAVFR